MKNKVVIITGASSGIGKALAIEFAKLGAHIVITGRNEARLNEVAEILDGMKTRNLCLQLDVAKEKDNEILVNETLNTFGKIDILINNAGISMRALFEEIEMDVFKKVMDINFYGTLYATKYCLPEILKTKGSIVGVSSINGYRGTPARTAYTASKYAMNGFMESLRTEVMHRGVHVLVACPGFTGTNIRNAALTADGTSQGESPRDEGKMMTAEEVAQGIIKAIQKRKRDIVFTSQGKLAVFLNKWMPGRMDKIVFNVFAKEPDSPFSAKK
ncbi:short-chain dehydrogenase [Roseivirga seohaensis subsp. aquiponti]|uniref:Short-chain dehydrogenase n=1 Tax=Roseivirga seohaensis subsp. aquiponti TaxID=1566026 RepID=A0A0L8AJJ9_9BACT|nr:SDR family oxidoreductase [Roseivirga seohaensis]KOF02421.1 short-chain dehydrogenase [Roseivirga seohaensis subsp. aquiponti]